MQCRWSPICLAGCFTSERVKDSWLCLVPPRLLEEGTEVNLGGREKDSGIWGGVGTLGLHRDRGDHSQKRAIGSNCQGVERRERFGG